MTREEAIKWLIKPTVTSTEVSPTKAKEIEAYDMAIEALQFAEHFDLLKEHESLQEVVRCKDCRYYEKDVLKPVHPALGGGTVIQDQCKKILGILPEEEGFCFLAERKEEE